MREALLQWISAVNPEYHGVQSHSALTLSMPMAWEPWPGNRNAMGVSGTGGLLALTAAGAALAAGGLGSEVPADWEAAEEASGAAAAVRWLSTGPPALTYR